MSEFLLTDRVRLNQVISGAGYVGVFRDTKSVGQALHKTGFACPQGPIQPNNSIVGQSCANPLTQSVGFFGVES